MKTSPKKRTNVSIDSDLLQRARTRHIKLSPLLEAALRYRLREVEADLWLDENREAIENYNNQVREKGVFSDGLRSF